MVNRSHSVAAGAPLLICFLALALSACRPAADDAESGPTIDVEPALEVSTDDDVVEVRPKNDGLSGILPGDFPSDVPLVLPASLVDYGEENGAQYIELATGKGRGSVEKGIVGLLTDRGWSLLEGSAEGTIDEIRLIKEGRPLSVVFRDSDHGAVYRIVY